MSADDFDKLVLAARGLTFLSTRSRRLKAVQRLVLHASTSEGARALAATMFSPDDDVVRVACEALRNARVEISTPALASVLHSESARKLALPILLQHAPERTVPVLVAIMADPSNKATSATAHFALKAMPMTSRLQGLALAATTMEEAGAHIACDELLQLDWNPGGDRWDSFGLSPDGQKPPPERALSDAAVKALRALDPHLLARALLRRFLTAGDKQAEWIAKVLSAIGSGSAATVLVDELENATDDTIARSAGLFRALDASEVVKTVLQKRRSSGLTARDPFVLLLLTIAPDLTVSTLLADRASSNEASGTILAILHQRLQAVTRIAATSSGIVAAEARKVLATLEEQGQRETLLNTLIYDGQCESLVPFALDCGYRHSDDGKNLLLLILSRRIDDYLAEDFEFQRLRPEYEAATHDIRDRVRRAIATAGDVRMTGLFAGRKRRKLVTELGPAEAEVLVQTMIMNEQWQGLVDYLPLLPGRSIASATRAIRNANFTPANVDQSALLRQLAASVSKLDQIPRVAHAFLPLGGAFESWACGLLDQTELGDDVLRSELGAASPARTIAALAALEANRRLRSIDLERAAQSPHWPVRLAAAALGGPPPVLETGGREWVRRTASFLSILWWSPNQFGRQGVELLQARFSRLQDDRSAGWLHLVWIVAADLVARDVELDLGAQVIIGDDAIELDI